MRVLLETLDAEDTKPKQPQNRPPQNPQRQVMINKINSHLGS